MTDTGAEALYMAVTEVYELAPHELVLLGEAQACADTCTELQAIVNEDGLMVSGPTGPKVHPAVVELRQQRTTLARLLVALRIPTDEEGGLTSEDRTQRRGLRGVYDIGGAA